MNQALDRAEKLEHDIEYDIMNIVNICNYVNEEFKRLHGLLEIKDAEIRRLQEKIKRLEENYNIITIDNPMDIDL